MMGWRQLNQCTLALPISNHTCRELANMAPEDHGGRVGITANRFMLRSPC